MENRKLWNELYKEARHRIKYPAENVIRFVRKNFICNGKEKILDLGCGAGRHVIYLADTNIVPYGGDFSASAVSYTKDILEQLDYSQFVGNIIETTTYNLPFEDDYFDGLICWGVLYYMDKTHIKESVREIYRVLKKNALALVLIRTVEDYRCQDAKRRDAKEVEERTFMLEEQETAKSAAKEDGMLMHFFTRDEVQELFADFSEITVDTVTQTHENGSYQDQDFLITLKK
ncbi:putative methyltransferase [Selenomonas ruminantium subsp. lactilytica TAM6421]|uniref:Putative methyltransferase n=1 Tax=Selenomonas ruminantium subsp. lactilytica (strain NBRC 103574 / TAM6421) TaxID=927704 RepID=I0GTI9_SELRL|nr:class I SAM-dependent methyltransferase [Selenomonas ruminantium]BAL84076.1 putative methyltransferase [Selenomonas ruminantium subsp. lactilytica TAM6421]